MKQLWIYRCIFWTWTIFVSISNLVTLSSLFRGRRKHWWNISGVVGVFAHFKISSSSNSRPPEIYQGFIISYSHILHCIYSYHLNIPDTNDASATNDEAKDDEKAEGEEDVDVDVLHPAHRLRLPLQFVQTCHHFEREKRCNIAMWNQNLTSTTSKRAAWAARSMLPMLQHSRARHPSLLVQSLPSIQSWNGSRMKSVAIAFWEWECKWEDNILWIYIVMQSLTITTIVYIWTYWLLPFYTQQKYLQTRRSTSSLVQVGPK